MIEEDRCEVHLEAMRRTCIWLDCPFDKSELGRPSGWGQVCSDREEKPSIKKLGLSAHGTKRPRASGHAALAMGRTCSSCIGARGDVCRVWFRTLSTSPLSMSLGRL